MAGYDAGTAFIQIVPSFAGIQSAIEEQFTELGETAAEVFNKALGEGTANASLGPSDASVAEQGERSAGIYADAFTARIDAASPSIRVGVDGAEAVGELGALEAAADGASGEGGKGGLSGLSSLFDDLPDFISPANIAIAGLATALIPVAGLAAGALATLPTVLAGIATGVGAIALAAPALETAVKSTFGPLVTSFKPLVDQAILPAFQSGLNALVPVFQSLEPFILDAATGIGKFVTGIAQMLSSSKGLTDLNAIFSAGSSFMKEMGTAATTLFGALLTGSAAAAPILKTIGDEADHLVTSFAHWVQTGGFTGFLKWLKGNGQSIVNDVIGIGSAVGKLVVELEPVGQFVLTIITAIGDLSSAVINLGNTFIKSPIEGFLHTALTGTDAAFGQVLANLTLLTKKFHLNTAAAGALAQKLKITLNQALTPAQLKQFSDALDTASDKTDKVGAHMLPMAQNVAVSITAVVALAKAAASCGVTLDALSAISASTGKSVTELAQSIAGAASATAGAFSSADTIVSAFSGNVSVAGATIAKFFTTSVTNAGNFAANIQTAISEGYNPALISQLIQAGPKQAGPILQGLVSTYSSSFVTLVNAGYQALQNISNTAVQLARLTQEAVSSSSTQMASDLSTAMGIMENKSAEGSAATVTAIATALGIGVTTVRHIAAEYGIVLPNALTAATTAAKQAASGQVIAATGALGAGYTPFYATGQSLAQAFAGGMSATQELVNQTAAALASGALKAAAQAMQQAAGGAPVVVPTGATSLPTGFATGGRPPVGVPSWVGERGVELFVPDVPGTIVANHALPALAAAVGGSTMTMGGLSRSDLSALADILASRPAVVMLPDGKVLAETVNDYGNTRRAAGDPNWTR